MNTEPTRKSDKELWQGLALEPAQGSVAVSDLELAAWLDGTLTEREAAQIEAALARDPKLRAAALDLADILGKPLPAPPPKMVRRAQALVGAQSGRSSAGVGAWWPSGLLASLLPSFDSGFAFQRGVMAGAAVIVAAVGFAMGGGLGASFAEQKYASIQSSTTVPAPLGSDTTRQLNDLFTDNI
ncbi:hypothetical protein SAMN02745126_04300 [Enhydrobacter aerosaccus]|uniref:Zinc-finger n=1 Tax=Enhydrobacter aerosaccus TaxID=225324 RepID=A0A1T4S203_9HYPH|nr:zf-HC2 domain-containing protein [Enhydrobacter aerosaccus]SKA22263.1 hypothetical protein SAMN02745126_04300 [Enhydrobacter aerosaccus]